MRFLRTNTAVIVTVGPFYDKTDGVTIETGLTITNERITLTADTDAGSAPTNILDNITGATSATANDLNYITGNDAGLMQLELAAADVNRLGRMFLSITDAANHVPVFHEFTVLPQAIYDWLILGTVVPLPANVTTIAGAAVSTSTAQLGVNAVQAGGTAWGSGAITAASIAADAITAAKVADGTIDAATFAAGAINAAAIATDAITATKIAADAIGASELAADAVTEIANAVWDMDATGHQTGGTFGQAIGDPVADTNTIFKAVVTDAAGATVGADIVAMKVDTAAILVDTGTTLDGRIPAALVSGRIDASVGAMAANVMTAAAAASDLTTELQTGLATAATLATVAGYLDTEIAAILADTNELQTDWVNGGRLDLILDAASAPSAATVADAVWDEAIAGHLTGGTTGASLNGAGSAGDPWTTAIPGAYGAGTAGKIVGDNLNATVSSRASQTSVDTVDDLLDTELAAVKSDTAAILVDTGTTLDARIPAALVAGRMDASVGAMAANVLTATAINADAITDAKVASDVTIASVTGAVGSVTGAVGSVTGLTASNLDAAISTRATPAQVNTEVVDALAVDTYAEPAQGTPSATTTLAAKINYLFKSWRNQKTNDGTTTKLFADDATTVDQKQTTSESAGTVTKGEWSTGP